jgi:hypothetical protein
MPSKKKARGRARREEKKNAAEAKCAVTKPCNSRNEMFDHFILPANCTEADIIECLNLYSELMLKVNIAETTWETKFRALNEIYPKYRGYSDRMKTVFRGLLLYDGTEAILKQASREIFPKAQLLNLHYAHALLYCISSFVMGIVIREREIALILPTIETLKSIKHCRISSPVPERSSSSSIGQLFHVYMASALNSFEF